MSKKPDYQLEFVYKKTLFNKAMWACLIVWLCLRVLFVVLYIALGAAFISSTPAILIYWAGGLCFGFAILTIIIYKRSIRVDEIEREKRRITKKL